MRKLSERENDLIISFIFFVLLVWLKNPTLFLPALLGELLGWLLALSLAVLGGWGSLLEKLRGRLNSQNLWASDAFKKLFFYSFWIVAQVQMIAVFLNMWKIYDLKAGLGWLLLSFLISSMIMVAYRRKMIRRAM